MPIIGQLCIVSYKFAAEKTAKDYLGTVVNYTPTSISVLLPIKGDYVFDYEPKHVKLIEVGNVEIPPVMSKTP